MRTCHNPESANHAEESYRRESPRLGDGLGLTPFPRGSYRDSASDAANDLTAYVAGV